MTAGIFRTTVSLDVCDKAKIEDLGTQAARGRCLKVLTGSPVTIGDQELLEVELCEDGYQGYLKLGEYLADALVPATFTANRVFDRAEILRTIPDVIAFLLAAMETPNSYLWGGTIGPDFDCSGLVQTAFSSHGIWLPRDAQNQYEFTLPHRVPPDQVEPGDLIFFSREKDDKRVNHVGVHLENGFYIHSSGIEHGRNGIGKDALSDSAGRVAANYNPYYWGSHRVCSSLSEKTDP